MSILLRKENKYLKVSGRPRKHASFLKLIATGSFQTNFYIIFLFALLITFPYDPDVQDFEDLYFKMLLNASFSHREDERDANKTLVNVANTYNFKCFLHFSNETNSFHFETKKSAIINIIHVNMRSL